MKIWVFKCMIVLLQIYGKSILKCGSRIFLLNHEGLTLGKISKISHLTCVKHLHGSVPSEYQTYLEKESELFSESSFLIEQKHDLIELLANYFLIQAYFYTSGIKTEFLEKKSIESYKKATHLLPSIIKLNRKEYSKLNKKSKSDLRKTKAEWNKQRKLYIEKASYDVIPKIEVTPSQISFILSISATTFFLSGFLYNRFFLGYYGIDVSQFFTISDYLSSSVDKIYIACIATLIGVVTYLIGMLHSIKDEVIFSQFDIKRKRSDLPIFLMVLACSIMTPILFYKDLPGKFGLLGFLIFFLMMAVYHRLPIEKLIKNSIYVSVYYVAIAYFIVQTFWSVTSNIEKIKNSKQNNNSYTFSFKTREYDYLNNMIFLSSNSNFIFFYDMQKDKSYVIPKNEIQFVESKKNSLTWRW